MRIWTKRDGNSWEGIDYDPVFRLFQWTGGEEWGGFGFPVTEELVREKFEESGRIFDRTKLPNVPRRWDGTWNGTLDPL